METKEIVSQMQKDDIKFVSLQFTDLLGIVKEVIIPVEGATHALNHGVWFDGSSIEGFARIQESDLFLKPDPATYAVIPWSTESNKTARLICDIHRPDGKPFEGDPIFILKKVVAKASKMGFKFNVGPEPEFYLFRENNPTTNLDHGGYFDFFSDEGYTVIKEINTALKKFKIPLETSHHEVGKGQYEIDFTYGHCTEIADKVLTLKYTVKRVAQAHGLHATFMPKPVMGAAGSGLHVHQSLCDIKTGENLFYDANDKHKLSKIAYHFLAGQLKHVKALCAVLAPTVNSYKRLVSGFEAPVYITWASMNRSALIRVPHWFSQKPESARIELRCPDPTCNPYLAFAVLLEAGLDGIKNKLTPPDPVEENVYKLDDKTLSGRTIDTLPTSLWESLEEFKKNKLMKDVFGEHLFETYINIKTSEWNEFKTQVTPWETNQYFDIY